MVRKMKKLLFTLLLILPTCLYAASEPRKNAPRRTYEVIAENAYLGIQTHNTHARTKGSYAKAGDFRHIEFQEEVWGGVIFNDGICLELSGRLHLNKSKPQKNHKTSITGPSFKVIKFTNTKYENIKLFSGIGFGHFKCKYFMGNESHSRKRFIPRGLAGAQLMLDDFVGIRGSVMYDHSSMLKGRNVKIRNSVSFGLGLFLQV